MTRTVSSMLILSLFNSNSTLIFTIFLLSPTNKDDGIGDRFRNNYPFLRQTDSTEGVDDDDNDDDNNDPWALTDGKYWLYILYLSMKSVFPPLSCFFHYSSSLFFGRTHPYLYIYTTQAQYSSTKQKEEQ